QVPAPTKTYALSLHDALPISRRASADGARADRRADGDTRGVAASPAVADAGRPGQRGGPEPAVGLAATGHHGRRRESRPAATLRSEEHTSELQSRFDLVCRLL